MYSEPRVTVRGIMYLDGKLFLQKLNNESGANAFWCTPGGKLDAGEDIMSGLHREIIEETGIEPTIGRLLFIQQYKEDDDLEMLEFFFHIENAADYLAIDLESTSHGTLEVNQCEFVDPRTETVLPKALSELNIEEYVTGNKPVYLMNYLKKTA